MRIIAIVQARMSSTRLPGKVLKPLLGQPMLLHVVERLRRSRHLNRVVIATTIEPSDHPLLEFCQQHSLDCFRGDLQDVLDRYYQCAREFAAEVIVRITSDCPLIDPGEMDRLVEYYLQHPKLDYLSNCNPTRTLPRGLDAELFPFSALERAWKEDGNPAWREHVTPYLYRAEAGFRRDCLSVEPDCSMHRWTVDTPEDFALIERIYQHFGHNQMSWREVLEVVQQQHPDWTELNRHIEQKKH